MAAGLLRLALLLVPAEHRTMVRQDLEEEAQRLGHGAMWCAVQAAAISLRLRREFGRGLRADAHYALRSLRHARWFTLGAVLVFALGLGVNVVVFSSVDRMLFRELPYAVPEQLMVMGEYAADDIPGGPGGTLPVSIVTVARRQHPGIVDLSTAGFGDTYTLTPEPDDRTSVRLTEVSHNTLEVFGVRVALGRDFSEDDARAHRRLALITHDLWRARFGGTDDVIGRRLWISLQPVEIAGVLPRGFIPASSFLDPESDGLVLSYETFDDRPAAARQYPPYVRLRPGVTIAQAQSQLDAIVAALRAKQPPPAAGDVPTVIRLEPLSTRLFGSVASYLWLVVGVAALVLLIACANLVSLMLVRGRSREQTVAMQLALGASPWRLARVALFEMAILSGAGLAVALVVQVWTESALRSLMPPVFNRYSVSVADPRVLLFALAALATCVAIVALVPAWRIARLDPAAVLQRGATAARTRQRPVGGTLIAIEAALGVLLVAGSVLTLKSLFGLLGTELGYNPAGLYAFYPGMPRTADTGVAFRNTVDVTRIVDELPGIRLAAYADTSPLTSAAGNRYGTGAEFPTVRVRRVTAGFLEVIGASIIAGRTLSAEDVDRRRDVLVLSEPAVSVTFPGRAPSEVIGRQIQAAGEPPREVIGVIHSIRRNPAAEPEATFFAPTDPRTFRVAMFVFRLEPDASPPSLGLLRDRLRQNGIGVTSVDYRHYADVLASSVHDQRFRATLFSVFGATALILASLGLYAVTAFDVALRRREIGIRLALGASVSAIQRRVVWQALRPVLAGLAAGVAGIVWIGRFLEAFLHNVEALAPFTFFAVAGVMLVSSFAAAWLPARRAAHTDPAIVLRAT